VAEAVAGVSAGRVVHVRDQVPGAVYVGRPRFRGDAAGGVTWGNPYRVGKDGTRAEVIARYRADLLASPLRLRLLPQLRGKPLACWCRRDGEEPTPENACHADVLLDLLSRFTDAELRRMGQEEPR
jgi:hypothetical protein